ncbi:NTP transferase domain-containing protein [Pedococcus sp. NPDC057267]|uniref:nucleotidyltransferase family protein n=1 Tax=Pedococcus sp. NPDC057267 TaxID=3346077 RepID=UPI00363FE211
MRAVAGWGRAPEPILVSTAGLLLAAGGGRRMGGAKALLREPSGRRFVERGLAVLREAGCSPVLVVVGAQAEEVRGHAAAADRVVEAPDWAAGQAASLRAGLAAVDETAAEAVCVLLVDLPDVDAEVVRRVVAAVTTGAPGDVPTPATAAGGDGRRVLGRAAYAGVPGHPVVIGRDHWDGVLASLQGDAGARDYLATHAHVVVECGDLATGRDTDTPADLA